MAFYLGIVDRLDDPLKIGRIKVIIPGLTGTERCSQWVYKGQLPGTSFNFERGDTALVLAIRSGPSTTLIATWKLPKAPKGQGSNLPRASDFSAVNYPKVKIINWGDFELFNDPEAGTLRMGQTAGGDAKIEFNTAGETTVDGTKVFLGAGTAAASRGGI